MLKTVQVFKIWAGQASEPYIAIGTDVVDALSGLVDAKVIDKHYEVRKAEQIGAVGMISQAAVKRIVAAATP